MAQTGTRWLADPRRAAVEMFARALPWPRLFNKRFFDVWEQQGYHIVPAHFYQPIPLRSDLTPSLWDWRARTFAFDFRDAAQLGLRDELERFKGEYSKLAEEPSPIDGLRVADAGGFGPVDAEVLYALTRLIQPKHIVEVGSGLSTWVAAQALTENRRIGGRGASLIAVDPYPHPALERGFPGLTRLVRQKTQDVDLRIFRDLGAGDFLFVDSSHVHKLGSDVQYLFAKILPLLARGVYVHFHDIFLPSEYPEKWVRERLFFWNEQHILENFLAFNTEFEVIWGGSYMHLHHPDKLAETFPSYRRERNWPGSFWLRRRI